MKIHWDQVGQRFYETGVRHGVLYPRDGVGQYPLGVAWNGLISVTESPSGAEPTPLYADDIRYLNMMSVEEFGASVEAYTYPDEFAECNGEADLANGVAVGQQFRRPFGLAYRSVIGNDTDGNQYGYKLHLIYNALASPSEKAYSTINDSPEAITFSWELTTSPEMVTGKRPTATIIIDSTKADPSKLAALEEQLFGRDAVSGAPETAASGTITVVDYNGVTDASVTITIGGVPTVLTEGVDFVADTSNDATAANLAAEINGIVGVDALAADNVITVTASTTGEDGNSIGMESDAAPALYLSGATLSGGSDGGDIPEIIAHLPLPDEITAIFA